MKFTIELDEYDTNNITYSTWISQDNEYIQQHTKRIMRDIAWQIRTQLETKQTQGETRGLDTIENVRYNEKLCGINGRWYVERPKGFDELPYDERQKIRKQNE